MVHISPLKWTWYQHNFCISAVWFQCSFRVPLYNILSSVSMTTHWSFVFQLYNFSAPVQYLIIRLHDNTLIICISAVWFQCPFRVPLYYILSSVSMTTRWSFVFQLYDFSAPSECPCTISYHPSRQIFACGFENGIVRIFNSLNTNDQHIVMETDDKVLYRGTLKGHWNHTAEIQMINV
jgi:hypothetical protein